MKLYHGSNMRVEKPDLQRSKPFKDFGQGFYLSDNYKQAEDLAIVKVEQIKMMKDELTVELADWLMSTYGYSPSEALDVLYTSETFERLQDTATGFYFQSVGYVSSFLKNEVENATFS